MTMEGLPMDGYPFVQTQALLQQSCHTPLLFVNSYWNIGNKMGLYWLDNFKRMSEQVTR
jgi:hypothetical protein